MIDTIADLINRINNAKGASHKMLELPFSNSKLAILAVLKKEGYISDFSDEKDKKTIIINLGGAKRDFKKITRVSRPGRRYYVNSRNIPRPKGGYGMVVISTPKGILSGETARKNHVGGEVMCEVY